MWKQRLREFQQQDLVLESMLTVYLRAAYDWVPAIKGKTYEIQANTGFLVVPLQGFSSSLFSVCPTWTEGHSLNVPSESLVKGNHRSL